MRISSPPTTHSCFYGIDTPERGKLLAARHTIEEMAGLIGVDSLAFISLDGLYRALGQPGRDSAQATFLRRLLHRRLPDQAHRHEGQHGPAAQPADRELMSAPVALVTGASRGIGAAVALELARAGFHIVATARTEGGLTDLDDAIQAEGGSTTLLPLDLLDGAGLDMIGPSIFDRFGRLDVLVHGAGALGRLTPVPHILPADWNAVVGVNLSAAWRLIRSCAPVLQAAPAGRAVFLTTQRAAEPRAYWGAYGATKAALDHLVLTWAQEVSTTALRVNLVDPGAVAGRLRTEAFPGEDPTTVAQPRDVAPAIAALCLDTETRHGQIIRLSDQA